MVFKYFRVHQILLGGDYPSSCLYTSSHLCRLYRYIRKYLSFVHCDGERVDDESAAHVEDVALNLLTIYLEDGE